MAYITCNNLILGYEGKAITENISFSVNQGDYLCIVGENGAGKSTLMKTLLRLQSPIDGDIIYGDDIEAYEVGYLPQQTMVQRDFPASVYEIVLSGALSKMGRSPFYSSYIKKIVHENMEKLGIWNLRKSCYRDLSGGQQQRVLLARALTATRKLLLLDEPTAGLDPQMTAELYQVIEQLNQEGVTIVMVSHDLHAAFSYASHIFHMGKNRLFYGSRQEYENSGMGRYFQTIAGNKEGVGQK